MKLPYMLHQRIRRPTHGIKIPLFMTQDTGVLAIGCMTLDDESLRENVLPFFYDLFSRG